MVPAASVIFTIAFLRAKSNALSTGSSSEIGVGSLEISTSCCSPTVLFTHKVFVVPAVFPFATIFKFTLTELFGIET